MKILRYIGSLAFVLGIFTLIFAGMPWHVMIEDDPPIPWIFRIAFFCTLGGFLLVMITVALEVKKKKILKEELILTESQSKIQLMTSADVPDKKISEVLDLVQGQTVYAIWVGKDLSAIVRLILGGELNEYTEMMGKARKLATNRMIVKAEKMGADAIINIRYMTTSVIGSAAELLVYGTAVKLSK